MTPAYARGGGVLLIAASILAWAWCLDQSDRNLGLRQSLERISAQVERLHRSADAALAPGYQAPVQLRVENAEQTRRAAAGFGSDARNLAAALQRAKQFCVAAKLAECQVRRATGFAAMAGGAAADASSNCRKADAAAVPASASASSPAASAPGSACQLTPYAVTVTATFDPAGTRDLLARLRDSGFLYRLQRINILQNRAEFDVIFFHSSDLRAEVRQGLKSGPMPVRTGSMGDARP